MNKTLPINIDLIDKIPESEEAISLIELHKMIPTNNKIIPTSNKKLWQPTQLKN